MHASGAINQNYYNKVIFKLSFCLSVDHLLTVECRVWAKNIKTNPSKNIGVATIKVQSLSAQAMLQTDLDECSSASTFSQLAYFISTLLTTIIVILINYY